MIFDVKNGKSVAYGSYISTELLSVLDGEDWLNPVLYNLEKWGIVRRQAPK
jgi:hypothetical protein